MSGLVDWSLAGLFIVGGLVGGLLGARSATSLAGRKGALNTVFAALICAVAVYMLLRSWAGFDRSVVIFLKASSTRGALKSARTVGDPGRRVTAGMAEPDILTASCRGRNCRLTMDIYGVASL